MTARELGKLYLTFDVEGPDSREDWITPQVLAVLERVLRLLKKYRLSATFFVTASVLKQIAAKKNIVAMLSEHEIGYHGSSHSIQPLVFEYTDVEDYREAVRISMERETSRIDLQTGNLLGGNGGILYLREVFPDKQIVSFRAPFLSWSPPHLEALRELGVQFDFSTSLKNRPSTHRGVTFYPSPIPVDSILDCLFFDSQSTLSAMIMKRHKVLMMHPASFLYERHSDFEGNREERTCLTSNLRNPVYLKGRLAMLELFFMRLARLERAGTLEVSPPLTGAKNHLNLDGVNVDDIYDTSMWAPRKFFRYEPRYLYSHYLRFFSNKPSNQ